jgi:hypothetical protein
VVDIFFINVHKLNLTSSKIINYRNNFIWNKTYTHKDSLNHEFIFQYTLAVIVLLITFLENMCFIVFNSSYSLNLLFKFILDSFQFLYSLCEISNLNLKIHSFIVLCFQRYATLLNTEFLSSYSNFTQDPMER